MKALWLGLALVPFAPSIADACSPSPCWPGAFVPRDGATIPANVPGFVWKPLIDSVAGDPAGDPANVTLVDTAAPAAPLAMTSTHNADGTYTFAPVAQLAPGHHYALADATQCSFDPGGTQFTTPGATFTVAAAAPLPTSLGVTTQHDLGVTGVSVLTLSGSCDAEISADAFDIGIALATDAAPWADALMYATTLDGHAWSPESSLAGPPIPGTSWTGRGTDRVFEACSGGDATTDKGAAAGSHAVALHATLPGTTLALDADATTVVLSCDDDTGSGLDHDGGDGQSHLHDGGGCSTSGGDTGAAFALLGLALVASSASGRRARRRR